RYRAMCRSGGPRPHGAFRAVVMLQGAAAAHAAHRLPAARRAAPDAGQRVDSPARLPRPVRAVVVQDGAPATDHKYVACRAAPDAGEVAVEPTHLRGPARTVVMQDGTAGADREDVAPRTAPHALENDVYRPARLFGPGGTVVVQDRAKAPGYEAAADHEHVAARTAPHATENVLRYVRRPARL